jgi:hypothetical protein
LEKLNSQVLSTLTGFFMPKKGRREKAEGRRFLCKAFMEYYNLLPSTFLLLPSSIPFGRASFLGGNLREPASPYNLSEKEKLKRRKA